MSPATKSGHGRLSLGSSHSTHTTPIKTSPSSQEARFAPILPPEIVLEIVSYIPNKTLGGQHDLARLCLVSKALYTGSIERLYESPWIASRNFDSFVATLCPSINLHVRRSDLGGLVRCLDMSHLLHDGSRSLTARVLGRVKENLEDFVAPAATFSLGCFAALSKCQKLKILNLTHVMQQVDLAQLFRSIGKLPNLHSLELRAAMLPKIASSKSDQSKWPRKLKRLTIDGHICGKVARFLKRSVALNECKLSAFSVLTHCNICSEALFLAPFTYHLRYLDMGGSLEAPLVYCSSLLVQHPYLVELAVGYNSIDSSFFVASGQIDPPHPLEILKLKSPPPRTQPLHWDSDDDEPHWAISDICRAITAGGLANLRQVLITEDVPEYFWWDDDVGPSGGKSIDELNDLMSSSNALKGPREALEDTGIFSIE